MVSGQYGERAMFLTVDNRVLFLDPPVAEQIINLGMNVREPFTITRKVSAIKGAPITWEVARPVGEQPDGSFVIPAPPAPAAAPASPPAPKPTQRAAFALVDETNALVDSFAIVLERALNTYQGA